MLRWRSRRAVSARRRRPGRSETGLPPLQSIRLVCAKPLEVLHETQCFQTRVSKEQSKHLPSLEGETLPAERAGCGLRGERTLTLCPLCAGCRGLLPQDTGCQGSAGPAGAHPPPPQHECSREPWPDAEDPVTTAATPTVASCQPTRPFFMATVGPRKRPRARAAFLRCHTQPWTHASPHG